MRHTSKLLEKENISFLPWDTILLQVTKETKNVWIVPKCHQKGTLSKAAIRNATAPTSVCRFMENKWVKDTCTQVSCVSLPGKVRAGRAFGLSCAPPESEWSELRDLMTFWEECVANQPASVSPLRKKIQRSKLLSSWVLALCKVKKKAYRRNGKEVLSPTLGLFLKKQKERMKKRRKERRGKKEGRK